MPGAAMMGMSPYTAAGGDSWMNGVTGGAAQIDGRALSYLIDR